MTVNSWIRHEVEAGGWVRKQFAVARRLRAERGPGAVADLALGQPLEAGEQIREAFEKAALDARPGRFKYMPNAGYPEVRERVAEDVDFPGVTAQGITMTVGAAGAVSLALRTFCERGEDVLGFAPYFSEFRLYSEAAGLHFRALPTRADASLDLDALAGALTPETGAVIVNSPCNPSGHVVDEKEMASLARVLDDHRERTGRQVLLVVDEVYHRLVYPPHRRCEPFAHWERTAIARSFSKDLGIAGERLGYLALHPWMTSAETEAALELTQRALGFVNAPGTAQLALMHLDTFDPALAPFAERRELAEQAVRAAGLAAAPCQGGLYLWVRSPVDDAAEFCDRLAELGTIVVPGVAFDGADHFRICFAAPLEALEIAAEHLRQATAAATI